MQKHDMDDGTKNPRRASFKGSRGPSSCQEKVSIGFQAKPICDKNKIVLWYTSGPGRLEKWSLRWP